MRRTIIAIGWLTLTALVGGEARAAQKLISGVPNYDQDVFPIDVTYNSVERGDCVTLACTMLHGYYDANGWPRLIPYGGSGVTASPPDNPARPYPGNAWGIDRVVRTYKDVLGYTPESGVYFSSWDFFLGSPVGDAIVAVVHYFEPGASFTREDDDWTSWSRIQSYLNANRPCVLAVWPQGAIDSYKWEGSSTLQELGGGHAVCAVGWSDVSGRWVMCNMGWLYATRAWFNYDSGDDRYISQITPGGFSSGEDDDAYEDNDTISTARQISPGTINNLRCMDTLLTGGFYTNSYGDWYKVSAPAGQSLSVTISFTHANGNLDLRVYDPAQTAVGSSTGSGNSEAVSVSPISAGYYCIFVYGYNNAQNQNYSLTVALAPPVSPPSAPTASAATAVTSSGFTANWISVSGATGYRLDVSANSGFSSFVSGYQDLDVGNVTSQNVAGLSSGTPYYYRVRAYNAGGTSGNSGTITATTLPNAPSAPTANPASGVTTSGFTASWSSVSGASGYRLDVSTSSTFSSYVAGCQDLDVGNVTSRSVSGMNAGTTYYYRVRAYNTGGTSDNSGTISLATTPPTVGFTMQTGQLVFSWPTNAVGFVLEYATDLPATSWTTASPSPVVVGGQNVVTNTVTGAARFYRLKKP